MSSERMFWILRSVKMLCIFIKGSENIEESENIKELKVVSDVKSYSWKTEFIIKDWLNISTAVKAIIESVKEKVLTECILAEDIESY